ncbi:MAG: aldo/keto reductase [Planctomycetota bacterium]|nr:aldo/keto reductase [Planctomycetota bacterium]
MASDKGCGRGKVSRRDFLMATAAGLGALPCLAALGEEKGKRSAIERVTLGKTKVRPTRLGFGTGSNGGQVQRALGEEGLAKVIRHAWDRGIRYIDTADHYHIHPLVGTAIKGLPREEMVLLTKIEWEDGPDINKELDRFRKELGTDYFDIVLLHCMSEAGWPEKMKKLGDGLLAAKEKGIVRAIGTSSHGLPALREVAACPWVDVHLCRVNHKGHHMDGPTGKWAEPGMVEPVMEQVKKIHAAGKGVLGMKLIGNGDFKDPEERERSIQAVMKCPHVDAVTIGLKSPAEVDEAIERINRALNG